jgi:uncharacterized RDD family membrane protein YckC
MEMVSFWDDARAKLTTPEQVDLHLEVANVGSRGLALLLDSVIRYGGLFVLYVVYVLANEMTEGHFVLEFGRKGFLILTTILIFGSEWLYFTVFELVWNGQTPGKRALRLRVIKEDGSPVTGLEVFARNLMRPLDTSGPMALIGMALIFFQKNGQRFGDMLARTMVVREAPIDWSLFEWSEDTGYSRKGLIRLEALEFEAVQRYVQRAPVLAPEAREKIAAQLRVSLQPRVLGTDLARPGGPAHEWLMELVKRL